MSQEPINIAGVCAFPNPNGVRDMRFVDCNYNTLFRLPNHSSIIMTKPDGTQMKQQCSYIDDYHIYIGQCGFHIMEFAEMAWRNGYTYLPEHPREQDCCDTYALYQIKDVIKTDYFCCAYERAKGNQARRLPLCVSWQPRPWNHAGGSSQKARHGAPARRRHPPRSLRQRYSAGQSKWQAGRLLCGGRKIPGAARQLCGAASPAEQAGKEQAQA